jgi:hypothetical protein
MHIFAGQYPQEHKFYEHIVKISFNDKYAKQIEEAMNQENVITLQEFREICYLPIDNLIEKFTGMDELYKAARSITETYCELFASQESRPASPATKEVREIVAAAPPVPPAPLPPAPVLDTNADTDTLSSKKKKKGARKDSVETAAKSFASVAASITDSGRSTPAIAPIQVRDIPGIDHPPFRACANAAQIAFSAHKDQLDHIIEILKHMNTVIPKYPCAEIAESVHLFNDQKKDGICKFINYCFSLFAKGTTWDLEGIDHKFYLITLLKMMEFRLKMAFPWFKGIMIDFIIINTEKDGGDYHKFEAKLMLRRVVDGKVADFHDEDEARVIIGNVFKWYAFLKTEDDITMYEIINQQVDHFMKKYDSKKPHYDPVAIQIPILASHFRKIFMFIDTHNFEQTINGLGMFNDMILEASSNDDGCTHRLITSLPRYKS